MAVLMTNDPLEFASASLRNQEAALQPSLEVEYTRLLERSSEGVLLERGEKQYRYIRTPDALRIDTLEKGNVVHKAFHNRKTREYRALSIGGSKTEGFERYGLSEPFRNTELLETSLYRLGEIHLVDMISRGKIAALSESIDGHECLKLDIPSGVVRPASYQVWLDPAIGCNPRRIDIVHAADRITTVKFDDYAVVTGNAWFPKKMTLKLKLQKQKWDVKVENTVTSIAIGKRYTVEELRPVYPSGTEVHGVGDEYLQP